MNHDEPYLIRTLRKGSDAACIHEIAHSAPPPDVGLYLSNPQGCEAETVGTGRTSCIYPVMFSQADLVIFMVFGTVKGFFWF